MKSDKELREYYVGLVKEFYKDKSFVVSINSALWGAVQSIAMNSEYTNAEIGQRIKALITANEAAKEEMKNGIQPQEGEELEDGPEL